MSANSAGTLLIYKVLAEKLPITTFLDRGITEEHFYHEGDRKLYEFIEEHQNEYGKLPDINTVKRKHPLIANIILPQEPLDYFVDSVKEKYSRNILQITAEGLAAALNNNESIESIVESLAEAQDKLKIGITDSGINSLVPLSGAIAKALAAATARRKQTTLISGASFGFDFLDRITDGAQGSDFITIAGRPGSAKTHVLCNAANSAYEQGKNVMIATFEMSDTQLARRLNERRTNMPSKHMKFGQVSSFGEKRINKHILELKTKEAAGHKLTIFHGSLFTTIATLSAKIQEVNPDVLYVDGAYLLKLSKGSKPMWETVAESATFLKNIAMTRNIPVIATYQINRSGGGKKASGVDTMMYSDAMGQLASIAFTLKTPEEAKTGESTSWGSSLKRIIRIDKGREGEAAEVEVELFFGRKPFRVNRVIHGDLSHVGYGTEYSEENAVTNSFGANSDFSEAS